MRCYFTVKLKQILIIFSFEGRLLGLVCFPVASNMPPQLPEQQGRLGMWDVDNKICVEHVNLVKVMNKKMK